MSLEPLTRLLVIELRHEPPGRIVKAAWRCTEPLPDDADDGVCGLWMLSSRMAWAEEAAYQHALDFHDDPAPYVCMEGQPK